jgi:NitT/TauT family transport system substrate-binding protein
MNSRKKKVILPLLSLLTAMAVLLPLSMNYRNNRKFSEKKTPSIRLALGRTILGAPLQIAHNFGFFTNEGLNVEFHNRYDSGKDSFEAMLRGDEDISSVATIPVSITSFTRDDFSIFATYTYAYDGVKIIADRKRISGVSGIPGRRAGLVKGTISEFLFYSFITFNKISAGSVAIRYYPVDDLAGALARKEVDMIAVWEPYARKAVTLMGPEVMEIETQKIYRITVNLAVMNSYAEANREVLVKLLRALKKSIEYLHSNSDESKNILSRLLHIDRDTVDTAWKDYSFNLSLDQLLVVTMENEAKWLIHFGYVRAGRYPNYLRYILTEPLSEVEPRALTIVK